MQNSVIWTWITSLYWSQPSSVVFGCKTADFGPELQVSMGPGPPQMFCTWTNNVICPRMTSLYEFQTLSVVLSTYNSVLSTRLKRQYCLQPSPVVLCMQNSDFRTGITNLCWSKTHLWFLLAKLRLLDQNNKSLWVPDMTCHYVNVQ